LKLKKKSHHKDEELLQMGEDIRIDHEEHHHHSH